MIEAMKQWLEALEYWDIHGNLNQPTEDAITSLRQAIAELESQEPVAWVDPATLYQLKIGLEGVHLVYETEMVNSLPLYEKPQGWRDNVAQAYLKGFDEGCKSMSARNGTQNIGSLGMPVNVPVTPPQRTWVGLTADEQSFVYDQVKQIVDSKPFWVRFADAIEAKLKEKNT